MKEKKEFLFKMKPQKLMWNLSIPAIIGMLVVGLYYVVDAIYIGQMISKEAMGAVSMAYPFTLSINAFTMLIGIGSASILSRAIGESDKETINKIMGNLIFLTIILSLLLTIPTIYFADRIMGFTGAGEKILDFGMRYLRVVFLGTIFLMFAYSSNLCLRGMGKMKSAMMLMVIGSGINIVLDPIFIIIFKRYDMAVEGVAYATVLSQFSQAAITLYYLLSKRELPIGKIKLETSILKEVLSIGLSGMCMQFMTIVQLTALFKATSMYGGEQWQILMGASARILSFSLIPLFGLSQAFQPAVGSNYGAKLYDRLSDIIKAFFSGAVIIGLPFFLLLQIFTKEILGLFIVDSTIVDIGIINFRIMFATYIFAGFTMLAVTFHQALGNAKNALLLVLGRQIIFYVPLVFLLPMVNNLGIRGVWLTPAIVELVMGLISIISINKTMNKIKEHKIEC